MGSLSVVAVEALAEVVVPASVPAASCASGAVVVHLTVHGLGLGPDSAIVPGPAGLRSLSLVLADLLVSGIRQSPSVVAVSSTSAVEHLIE